MERLFLIVLLLQNKRRRVNILHLLCACPLHIICALQLAIVRDDHTPHNFVFNYRRCNNLCLARERVINPP